MAYFILAYALSWAIAIPLAAVAHGWLHVPLPPALHYLASFEPMLSALIVTAATEGSAGIRQLLAGIRSSTMHICTDIESLKTESMYKPVRFFAITFLLTWVFGFIAAYFSYQKGMEALQGLCMIPGLFAPFIAAMIMVSGAKNQELRKDLWARLSLRKINLRYLPAILLIMPFALFLATAISLLFGQPADQFQLSSDFKSMGGQAVLTLLILFMAPTFEELGWRGYGVDSIRSTFTLFKTTVLFGILWALWHVPLFFVNGYYQHELWNTSIVYVINFFAQIFVAAVLMNWIYYKSNRSIAAAILFHFMFNLFSVLFQTEQFTKCIITMILLIISVVIIVRNKEFFFGQANTRPPLAAEPAYA